MKTIDTSQLKEMRQRNAGLAIVNVLSKEQFEKEHIPDSANIPLTTTDFEQQIRQLAGGKDEPVVVYCASADCDASPKAAKRLDAAGFTAVYDYEAGMRGWKQAKLPVNPH
ncbi:MAG: rhodanese-like domain-containing protein [Bryobacterales bacterium]